VHLTVEEGDSEVEEVDSEVVLLLLKVETLD
jgi:hypothetical protein